MKLKCPVCKSVIEFENDNEESIQCGLCDSVFNKEKILAIHRTKRNRREKNTKSDKRKNHIDRISSFPEKPSTQIDEITSSTVHQKAKLRTQRVYLSLGIGAAALALLSVTIWVVQSQTSNRAENANDATPFDDLQKKLNPSNQPFETHSDTEQLDSDTLPDTDEESGDTPPDRTPFANLDSPEDSNRTIARPPNRFKSKKALDRSWFNIKPYLLELYAETPIGPQTATGIVVDSRGWVVTSYNAFKNANEISLRRAVNPRQTDNHRLDDKVRGFVAAKPEHDLLLLSINRRLVDTIEDLAFSQAGNMVASKYVIQCQPPTSLYPYSAEETQIRDAATIEKLKPTIAKRLQWRNFDPEIRWLAHTNRSPLKIGAPLLDDRGDLRAINTAAFGANEDQTVAIPASYITALKNSAEDKVQPLPVESSDEFDQQNKTSNPAPAVVDINTDSRPLSERLNQYGELCQAFSWLPNSESERDHFRQFLVALVSAHEALENNDLADADFEKLSAQTQQWSDEMKNGLGAERSLTNEAQVEFNRAFAAKFVPGQPFAAFVFISHAAINLQKIAIGKNSIPREAVGFEFKGLPNKMIANIESSWPALPVDSPWLIIGTELPGVVRLSDRQGNVQTLRMGQVDFVMQANAP